MDKSIAKADFSASLTPAQKSAYDAYSTEWGRSALRSPEIKVSYANDDTKSLFILKDGDETKILGKTISGVIMKVRNQYSLYNEDRGESLRTNEFDTFNETITLFKGGNAIKSGPYQEIKALIKKDYPGMKYINILYFMYNDKLYKIMVRPASRQNLWDFQSATSGRAPFSFTVELSTTTGSRGATIFYPITFKKTTDMSTEEFKKYFDLRMELDKTIRQMESSQFVADEDSTDDIAEIFNS